MSVTSGDQPQPSQYDTQAHSPPLTEPASIPIPYEQAKETVEHILDGFSSTGGMRINFEGDDLWISPDPPIPDMSEQELISTWESKYRITITQLLAEGLGKEKIIEEMRSDIAREDTWLLVITDRDTEQMTEILPPLKNLLAEEHGKIVVLGNGFSSLPIELAEMRKNGQLHEQPVIVDLINYRKIYDDFVTLQKKFVEAGIQFPFLSQQENVRQIVTAMDSGNVDAIQYKVGSRNSPPELLNASLLINVYGPPITTVQEQLGMLRTGGKLLISEDIKAQTLNKDFNVVHFSSEYTRGVGSLVTRKN